MRKNFFKNCFKFDQLRKYNLPIDQYAITGSGPLGIRDLRKINDIDIIVSISLWEHLAKDYGIVDENGVKKIIFPDEMIEAFKEGSFYTAGKFKDEPSVMDRITQAEMIDDLPFESLKHILFYKKIMNRPKDLDDIQLIESLLKNVPH